MTGAEGPSDRAVGSGGRVRHPVFARIYNALDSAAERGGAAEHRDELLAGLSGRVVEVGAGTGSNFSHYPDTVTEVIAVEPEPWMRQKAEQAAAGSSVPVTVCDGIDTHLPVESGWADAVVASLVLCSVDDPTAALTEMRRVVRPGGELRFYEHVRSADPRKARWQERIDVIWPKLFGGCHTSRDVVAAVEAARWRLVDHRDFRFSPGRAPNPVAPHTIGRAVNGPDPDPSDGISGTRVDHDGR